MASQAGKRLKCGTCGGEIVVTKAGEGQLKCCSAEMGAK